MRYLKLSLFIFLLYAPFMGYRVLRTAGDDKVYVAQALEMARDGHWFVQTLADRPDYYKGPFHFLLLRLGMFLFGKTMWATVYMNLALVLLGAWALCALVARNMPDGAIVRQEKPRAWGAWAGAAFATGIGVYLHAYASQMEVELAAFYAFGIYCLSRSRERRFELLFWLVAGLTGWIKSPLHSAFLGTTAILYWLGTGELWARLKSLRSWGYALIGILTCIAGYLPMYLLDGENWVKTYILRETFNKGPSGEPWYSPVWPILTFFLFPWMLPMFVAYLDGLGRAVSSVFGGGQAKLGRAGRSMLVLGVSLVAPSMAFFVWFSYRAQNYTLPAVAGMMLILATLWSSASRFWRILYQGSVALTGVFFVAGAVVFAIFGSHFQKFPDGWPLWLIPALAVGGLATGLLWIKKAIVNPDRPFYPQKVAYAVLPFYLAFGALYVVLGEREMLDLKRYIAEHRTCEGKPLAVGYYNLQRKLWSEWGYLNFMVSYPIEGLHTPEALEAAIRDGKLILIQEPENAEATRALAAAKFPDLVLEEMPWHRWRTQGRAPDGSMLWQAAWDQADLSLLQKNYYMLRYHRKDRPLGPGC